MTTLSFDINANTGDLDRILSKLNSLPMDEVAAFGERQHRNYYAEQAGPDGGWAGTQRGGSILRDTGAMAASVSSSSGGKTARVFSAGPFYNIFHQAGTSKMPARKHVGIRPGTEDQYLEPIRRHLGQ